MTNTIRTLSALLLAAFILIAGNNLQGTLLAIRGDLEGFSLTLVGLLMSAYFVGFIAGCRYAPGMVKRVGHIRSFTALASLASASALAHLLAIDATIWIVLRVISGFCLAGLHMILESWLNENATNETRGRILSVYRITDLSAATAGQMLLAASDPAGFVLFALVSILMSIALVPVALTTSTAPQPISDDTLNLKRIFHISPLAGAGCFAVGAANGAFWAIAAVFVQRLGYSVTIVAWFMSAVVIAGAVSQWPLGHLSDRIDRRLVIIGAAGGSTLGGVFLSLTSTISPLMLLAGGCVFGLFAMPLFGLSVAHANDRAKPTEYVSLNAGLLLLYGAGAVAGPVIAPVIMQFTAPQALFLYTSSIHVLLVVFGIWRVIRRDAVPEEEREDFISVPRTSPGVFEMNPNVEED
ncbi:MFS transporter [Hyphococcus flavus]|uniref:MFS transporter n=1 Tax=Hyphococcus flavus TaxID=1866326 RepID=A0AAE9ZEE4_9PROT|nr:MFS transporter [Hyphococcus flavus]WDI32210.1 MFS transporter [Hyphococcus flavus]